MVQHIGHALGLAQPGTETDAQLSPLSNHPAITIMSPVEADSRSIGPMHYDLLALQALYEYDFNNLDFSFSNDYRFETVDRVYLSQTGGGVETLLLGDLDGDFDLQS